MENTIAVQNIINIAKSFGDELTADDATLLLTPMEHYTRQGLTFGDAYLESAKWLQEQLLLLVDNLPPFDEVGE